MIENNKFEGLKTLLYEAIKQWVIENWRLPIPYPVEHFIHYDPKGREIFFALTNDLVEHETQTVEEELEALAFQIQLEFVSFPIQTKYVCDLCGCVETTATKWAKINGVNREVLENGKAGFMWSEDDCIRFNARSKAGRRHAD